MLHHIAYLNHCYVELSAGKLKKNSSVNSRSSSKNGDSEHIAAQTFPFRELAVATRNFRAECLLGEGGFGRVYKGHLESVNQVNTFLIIILCFPSFKLVRLELTKDSIFSYVELYADRCN